MSKVAKFVGSVVSYGLAILTAPYGGAPFFAKLGNYLLISAALDVAVTNLTDTPDRPRVRHDVEYSDTTSPGRFLYGEMRISGMNVIPPWKSGAKDRYLHQVLVQVAHEIHAQGTTYFDKEPITSIGSVTGTVNDGRVTAGKYVDAAWIRAYRGTSGQTADFILNNAFGAWGSDHRGRGNAYRAIQFDLENEEVYEHGRKPEVTSLDQGKRCYDPRLDSSPGADPTNAAFIAYTTNPALCLPDYLMSVEIGCAVPAGQIDWDSVVSAANICDELVAIPGSTSQKRYTCNVLGECAQSEEERRQNIRMLAGAMMGAADFRGDSWRIHAGAAADSTFALTESDVRGELTLRTEIPANQKYNYVTGQFVDKSRNYQLQQFEPRSNSSYESTDGHGSPRRLAREVSFPCCDNQYEAQRNALIVLKRSRRKRQISATWSMAAFRIRLWDTGTITLPEYGWNAQKVRCIAWKFNQEGSVDATFLEELDSDWDDPAVGDYTVPGTTAGPPPVSPGPEPVAGFTVRGVVDGVHLKVDYPRGWQPRTDYFRVWVHTSASPFSAATPVEQSKSDRIDVPLTDTNARFWWVTHQRLGSGGSESEPTPDGDGVECRALALTDQFHANVSPSNLSRLLIGTGSGNTSNQATVTPVKGTSPYTIAWTRISGSTKISAIASTSFTTGFSGSGLVNGEVAQATFRGRVTDNAAATADAFVKVTFRRDDQAYN